MNRYIAIVFFLWSIGCIAARADDFNDRFGKLPCPSPEPCKVVILSQSEERILMQPNGILDTAAQARALDLGQFAVYLKTKISAAPAGESLKVPEKHDAPVDNPIK